MMFVTLAGRTEDECRRLVERACTLEWCSRRGQIRETTLAWGVAWFANLKIAHPNCFVPLQRHVSRRRCHVFEDGESMEALFE